MIAIFFTTKKKNRLGGSAVNTARHFNKIAVALQTDLFTTVGDDELSRFIQRKLEDEKLATNVEVAHGVPQAACIVLPGPSDRAFISCWGSCSHVSPKKLMSSERPLHVHFGGYFQCPLLQTKEILDLVTRWKAEGTTFSLDPQYDSSGKWSGTDGHLHRLIPLLDYLLPNDFELHNIFGAANADAALPLFAKAAPNTTLVLKCGEAGVKAYKAGNLIAYAGIMKNAKVVDTTGAGDAFNAGFLAALLTKHALVDALRHGCAAGGLCVGRLGACDSPLTSAEIDVALAFVQ